MPPLRGIWKKKVEDATNSEIKNDRRGEKQKSKNQELDLMGKISFGEVRRSDKKSKTSAQGSGSDRKNQARKKK